MFETGGCYCSDRLQQQTSPKICTHALTSHRRVCWEGWFLHMSTLHFELTLLRSWVKYRDRPQQ